MSLMELNKFYGRKPTLDLLKRRVLDLKDGYRQNIAFLGGRYSGKSIILQKFIADLEDKDIVTIYLELENQDIHYFYTKFVGSLLYHYSRGRNLSLYDDVDLLIENTQKQIPQTIKAVRKIKTHINQGKTADAYREIISLPETFTKETNKFCLLVFDEFQHLEDMSVKNVYQELGKKIMTQKKCLYIVTSSLPGVAQQILSEKLSLLFGNFEEIHVDTFDFKTSQEFIRFHLRDVKIGEHLQNFLIDFTGGHPLYLRFICQELNNACAIHKQGEIYLPLVSQAIESILFNEWGVLSRHFDLMVSKVCAEKDGSVVSLILMELSNGKQKMNGLIDILDAKKAQVRRKVSRLVELGILGKNGNFYYIEDKLMRYWLKYVYQKRRKSVALDHDGQQSSFREELSRSLIQFRADVQKDLSSRIVELLHCFEDEAYFIKGRRYKLSAFRKITPSRARKLPDENLEIIRASTGEGDWMIAFKPGTIEENDVSRIAEEAKKSGRRPSKCILISLSDMDENARVKALQEKMWIWSEGELHALLNLYGKSYIMQ